MGSEGPTRWALLRHDLPDGTWHLDWLIERPGSGLDLDARVLLAWRLGSELGLDWRPDSAGLGEARTEVEATRMDDHRRAYLTYEGPIPPRSGQWEDRGRVQRLAEGIAVLSSETPDRVEWRVEGLELTPTGSSVHWVGARARESVEGSLWRLYATV